MLKDRIISTLRFFDMQDYPLTLLELGKFLMADLDIVNANIDGNGELKSETSVHTEATVGIDGILKSLDTECRGVVDSFLGFYFLAGRKSIAEARWHNYFFGIKREKLIRRYVGGLRHLPFVRGVALAGSQALGQQKAASDVDLFIIIAPNFLWLGRTLVTAYFQILGKRRYGDKISNRFCLNHYLAGAKNITELRNLYTASEYLKLRPLVYSRAIWEFQNNNRKWLEVFFPESAQIEPVADKPSWRQVFFEKIFTNSFGAFLEKKLQAWQLPKIRQEKFIVVAGDELSFHPESKQQPLLARFFQNQQQEQRVAKQLVV